jgi:hypothetical protein
MSTIRIDLTVRSILQNLKDLIAFGEYKNLFVSNIVNQVSKCISLPTLGTLIQTISLKPEFAFLRFFANILIAPRLVLSETPTTKVSFV